MARPFDRPDLDQRKGGLALYITGLLPNAKPLLAYEGRLGFHNAIGDCAADLFGGVLPPGSTVSVDNTAQQIVVTWPAYQAAAAPIENPGFENGDVGWEFGPGWSVTTDNPPAGAKCAVFQSARGESMVSSKTRYPVTTGQSVSASCAVRQGASSSGNAGAAVCLEFRDAGGNVVRSVEGNRVMSASNNAVKPSNVTAAAQAGEATINVAGKGIRKRQNRDVWIDTFAWNVTQPSVGTNVAGVIGPITIRLTDSVGRTAFWTGVINVVVVTLDPAKKAAEVTLSSGNLGFHTFGFGNGNWCALSTEGHASGKYYFEVLVVAGGAGDFKPAVGISRAMAPFDPTSFTGYGTDLGQEAGEYGLRADGNRYAAGSFGGWGVGVAPGDVIGCAVDLDNGKMWFSKNGVWQQSGNPVTGANTFANIPLGPTYYAAVQAYLSASPNLVRFDAASFSYAPPAGFSAL